MTLLCPHENNIITVFVLQGFRVFFFDFACSGRPHHPQIIINSPITITILYHIRLSASPPYSQHNNGYPSPRQMTFKTNYPNTLRCTCTRGFDVVLTECQVSGKRVRCASLEAVTRCSACTRIERVFESRCLQMLPRRKAYKFTRARNY